MKTCSRCKVEKEVTNFCKMARSKDGYQPACKSCMNVSWTNSRLKKKQHYADVRKKRRNTNLTSLKGWKSLQKCYVCPEDNASCLDFHHLDPSQKEGAISDVSRSWSFERLSSEIDKCVVLCSNCHRKYHGGQLSLLK